jgi:tetratricopeptide (TPR) repeat protein
MLFASRGDYDLALEDYTQAIKLDPNLAAAYFGRGNAYYHKDDYDWAIADYTQAIKLDPDDKYWGYNRLFNIYYDMGNYTNALNTALEAVELFPRNFDGYDNLGYVYEKLGDSTKAKAAYLQAERLAPNPNPYLEGAYYNRPEARVIMR